MICAQTMHDTLSTPSLTSSNMLQVPGCQPRTEQQADRSQISVTAEQGHPSWGLKMCDSSTASLTRPCNCTPHPSCSLQQLLRDDVRLPCRVEDDEDVAAHPISYRSQTFTRDDRVGLASLIFRRWRKIAPNEVCVCAHGCLRKQGGLIAKFSTHCSTTS